MLERSERAQTSQAVRQLSKRIGDWAAETDEAAKVPEDDDELRDLVQVWNIWLGRDENARLSMYTKLWEVAHEKVPALGVQRRGPVNMAPTATEAVRRPRELDQIKRLLLDPVERGQESRAVGVTTGVHGAGGFGKTTLAMMLAHDPDIVRHFRDGVLWAELGEQAPRMVDQLNDMVQELTCRPAHNVTPNSAKAALEEALTGKRVLLVVDDLWHHEHLEPFRVDSPGTALLVTTRQTDALPGGVETVRVDAMTAAQSRELLLAGIPLEPDPPYDLLHVRDRVQQASGGWAVLLSLINGQLRDDTREVSDPAEAADIAIQDLTKTVESLAAGGITHLDPQEAHQRHQAVEATMRASLDRLGSEEENRYLELAVFPDDADVPLRVLERYWAKTASWDPARTQRFCTRLKIMSLLDSYTRTARVNQLRLHDVIRDYLRERAGADLPTMHAQLLEAHQRLLPAPDIWWGLPDDEDYLWSRLGLHLVAAARVQQLVDLLTNALYLAAKLDHTGPSGLEADLHLLPAKTEILEGIGRALRQSAHLLQPLAPAGSLTITFASRLPPGPGLDQLRTELEEMVRPRLQLQGPTPDLAHPALRRTLRGHRDDLTAVTIAPDGSWLATASADRTVRIWDPVRGVELNRLPKHPDEVTVLAAAPSGKWIVSVSNDTAWIWNTASGTELRRIGQTEIIRAATISPDGAWLVTGSDDTTAIVWNATTGEQLHVLEHPDRVIAATVSPDGTWIATACSDHQVRIWSARSGKQRHCLEGHDDEITGLAISPDGAWLATASRDTTARIWSARTGKQIHRLEHPDFVSVVAVSPVGGWIVTVSEDITARIWDVRTGEELHTLDGHDDVINGVTIAPDGGWLVTVSDDSTACVWSSAGELRQRLTGHTDNVTAAAIASDATWLVTIGEDDEARVWDYRSNVASTPGGGHTFPVEGIAVAPDETWLATVSDDARIQDVATGVPLHCLDNHEDLVTAVAVAPDSTWLVTGSDDQTARIWDATSGRELRRLDPAERVRKVAVAPDGTWLVTGGEDSVVQIWDTASGRELHRLNARDDVTALLIAPNGSWIAAGGEYGVVRLFDAATGHELHSLHHPRGGERVTALAVAPDSAWLVTGSHDGTAYVWDATNGQELHRLDARMSRVPWNFGGGPVSIRLRSRVDHGSGR